jgi:hypothetical protein
MRLTALPLIALALLSIARSAAADEERTRELVRYNNVEIDVITEGTGPLVVLLPSRGRDSEDYDEVAHGIAA